MNPWLFILATALGLPLGVYLQSRRERRAEDRRQRDRMRQAIEESKLWEDAQDRLNDALREAWLSAQLEMRQNRIRSAETCGCATCREYLRRETLGRN